MDFSPEEVKIVFQLVETTASHCSEYGTDARYSDVIAIGNKVGYVFSDSEKEWLKEGCSDG